MLHLREVGMACRKGHGPWDPGNQKCILRAHPSLPPHFPPILRRGEGAFRLQPKEPLPPRPVDKYELRETKRRLQQGLDGPRACAHPPPLRRDLFCGECGAGTLSCWPVFISCPPSPSPFSALLSSCPSWYPHLVPQTEPHS